MRTLLALLCVTLAGCTVSDVPVTGEKLQTDERLLGTWQTRVEDEMETMIVTLRDDGALIVEPPPKDGVDQQSERLRLVTARVGGHWYLSVTGTDEPPGNGSYMLLRYEFRGPKRIELFAANPGSLLEAIARKQVSGEEVPDRHMESIKLTSDAAALRAFIAKHGAANFKEPLPAIDRVH
jgi:hypothetical protein